MSAWFTTALLTFQADRYCGSVYYLTWTGVMALAEVTEAQETGLRFAVLGPLEVTRSGERLSLGGHQRRAVLALLLSESGTVVSVGRLGDALWGQETPSGFVTTIQT